MLAFVFASLVLSAFRIGTAEAVINEVYIRADGSIYPDSVPITTVDNVTYTFTNDLFVQVVVQRNNIVIDGAGHVLRRNGTGRGVDLTERNNVTVRNLQIENFTSGIWMQQSSDIKIMENTITNNTYGIWLWGFNNTVWRNKIEFNMDTGVVVDLGSANNTIVGNTVGGNAKGFWLNMTSQNHFYYNNIVGNGKQLGISYYGYANLWDNGFEGNYWGDYTGVDIDAGGDGRGDTALELDSYNVDRFPLMYWISFFEVGTWNETAYYVHTSCNSSVFGFFFSPSNTMIGFGVSGPDGTVGACRVAIPREVLWCEDIFDWIVRVNDSWVPVRIQELPEFTYLFFTYSQSVQTVEITGTRAIPEFSSLLVLTLFMMVTLATLLQRKRKLSLL